MVRLILVACLAACAVARGPQGKIVGGDDTKIEEYPHQISLQFKGKHDCGGSIISEKWILTASHCINDRKASDLTVRAGSTEHDKNGEVHKVKKLVVHPKYVVIKEHNDFDYALLELETSIKLGAKAKAITLPAQGEQVKVGTEVTITGWGRLYDDGPTPETLQVVKVKVVDRVECGHHYNLTERMLCAGVAEGGMDACQGDSGGPLITEKKLVGIVSFGWGCAEPEVPGIYAQVSNQRDWIKSISGV